MVNELNAKFPLFRSERKKTRSMGVIVVHATQYKTLGKNKLDDSSFEKKDPSGAVTLLTGRTATDLSASEPVHPPPTTLPRGEGGLDAPSKPILHQRSVYLIPIWRTVSISVMS